MNVLFHHRTRAEEVEGVHIRGITGALRSFGHRVDVISPPGVHVAGASAEAAPRDRTDQASAPRVVAAASLGLPAPPAPRHARSPWSVLAARAPEVVFEAIEVGYNAWAWSSLRAQLQRRDYRLLYDRYALFSVAAVMAAQRHGVPLILEVNDSAVLDRIRPLKLKAAARRVERFVWNAADAIVTISGYFRDLIIEAGVRPSAVHVIANAVDRADFEVLPSGVAVRAQLGLDGKLVIAYLGAINHWRRLDLLIDAFAELAPRHPRAHLLVVGDGPDREGLEAAVAQRGLSARASFTGRVRHAEVGGYLAAADLTVIPHSNDYGSPMKMFECMAAGKPVVAPWLPPIVSVLGAEDGGVLFAPLDVGALGRALEGLLEDPARRALLGSRARDKVLSEYVWRHHAERILEIQSSLPVSRP